MTIVRLLALCACLTGCRADVGKYLVAEPPRTNDKVTVDNEGRLLGPAPDGYYAVYRHGKYRGELKRAGEYVTRSIGRWSSS